MTFSSLSFLHFHELDLQLSEKPVLKKPSFMTRDLPVSPIISWLSKTLEIIYIAFIRYQTLS